MMLGVRAEMMSPTGMNAVISLSRLFHGFTLE
jgi:hypothetical protein